MFSATQPCACDRLGNFSAAGEHPASICDKEILSREEEVALIAMRELHRKARCLKEELRRIKGNERLVGRQQVLERMLTSYRETFRSHQEERERASRQKHLRLGHLDPWDF